MYGKKTSNEGPGMAYSRRKAGHITCAVAIEVQTKESPSKLLQAESVESLLLRCNRAETISNPCVSVCACVPSILSLPSLPLSIGSY